MTEPKPLPERIPPALQQVAVTAAQANAALTTLTLLAEAGDINRKLQRNLVNDALVNLRSVLRTAQAAIDALEGRTNG